MCRDEVREELTAAIVDGFIERVDGFRVAEQLGMSSVGANSAAGAAIDRFLKHARQIAGSSDLSSVEGRLRGFQKRVVVGPFRWSRESFFRDFEDVEQSGHRMN